MACEIITRHIKASDFNRVGDWYLGDIIEIKPIGFNWGKCDPIYGMFYVITIIDKDRDDILKFYDTDPGFE